MKPFGVPLATISMISANSSFPMMELPSLSAQAN